MEGRLSQSSVAYAAAARPITSITATAAARPRNMVVRRIFWQIGDHAAWIRARGLCPPFVFIRSGTFRAMNWRRTGFYAVPPCRTPVAGIGLRGPDVGGQPIPPQPPLLLLQGAQDAG